MRSLENTTPWRDDTLRTAAAIALLVLAVAAPITYPGADQQASRYATTAAIWDHQTFALNDYTHILGRDKAVFEGIVYSDKAPLQPLLAVPFYGIYRALGGEPAEELSGGEGWFNYGLWWVTLWSATMPGAILAGLMFAWSREIEPSTALHSSLSLAFGSLLLVYSAILFGHVLAAVLVFTMFLLLRKPDADLRRLAVAGFIGGAAVLVEYPAALIVAVLTAAAFVAHRRKALAVIAGGFPAVVLLGLYNWYLFGSPLMHSYRWNAFSGTRAEAGPILGQLPTGPSLDRFAHMLFSERGLIVAAPIIALAVAGLVLLWVKGARFETAVITVVVLVMIGLQASWSNSYAGGAGPRYFTPAVPFLAAPLALAWKRWPKMSALLAGISVLTMVSALFTNPQLPSKFSGGLGYWLSSAVNGYVASSVFTLKLGAWGWILHVALILIALALLHMSRQQHLPPHDSSDPASAFAHS